MQQQRTNRECDHRNRKASEGRTAQHQKPFVTGLQEDLIVGNDQRTRDAQYQKSRR